MSGLENINNDVIDDENEDDIEVVLDDEEDDSPAGGTSSKDKDQQAGQSQDNSDDDEDDDDSSSDSDDEDSLSDDERNKMGRRAQARIRKLVAERNAVREKYEELEGRLNKIESERQTAEEDRLESDEQAIKDHHERLKNAANAARASIKAARANDDGDAEFEAIEELTRIRAEEIALKQAEQHIAARKKQRERGKSQQQDDNNQDQNRQATDTKPQQQEPDPRAKSWAKRNSWFGGDTPEEKRMTRMALTVHHELMDEGFDPAGEPDDYYSELDTRMRESFPELKNNGKSKKKPAVAGGPSRGTGGGAGGKNTIRLTRSQLDMAKKLGIDPKSYAKELAKINARQGE